MFHGECSEQNYLWKSRGYRSFLFALSNADSALKTFEPLVGSCQLVEDTKSVAFLRREA
jgi:hypothetical protein